MEINQLITPERVKCLSGIGSKKRALESLGHLLSSGAAGIDPTDIFNRLIERERSLVQRDRIGTVSIDDLPEPKRDLIHGAVAGDLRNAPAREPLP